MNSDLRLFKENSHYFAPDGNYHPKQDDASMTPEAIKIKLKNEKIMQVFILNNPWKHVGSDQIFFQHCLFCCHKRYDDQNFSNRLFWKKTKLEDLSLCCEKRDCSNKWFEMTDPSLIDPSLPRGPVVDQKILKIMVFLSGRDEFKQWVTLNPEALVQSKSSL